MGRLNNEATAADFEGLSAERTTLSSEGRSFSLEVGEQLSQRRPAETWEVESGKCPLREVESVFKFPKELADLKQECMKEDNQD